MAVSIFKRPLNKEVEQIKNDIGIVENGTTATHNISSGQYVIWQGNLCTASSAISSGDTLSSSNLTEVSNGGLNALNGKITPVLVTVTAETGVTISSQNVYRIGKIVLVNIQITIGNSTISNTGTMVRGFPAPLQSVPLSGHRNQVSGSSQAVLSTGGNLNNDWDEFLASKKYHFNFAYACQ